VSDDGFSLRLPAEAIETIARRAAEIVLEGETVEADGWLRGAERIAAYLDCPTSRVYALASTKPERIPVERDGSALIARRSDLDRWLRNGGGRRT